MKGYTNLGGRGLRSPGLGRNRVGEANQLGAPACRPWCSQLAHVPLPFHSINGVGTASSDNERHRIQNAYLCAGEAPAEGAAAGEAGEGEDGAAGGKKKGKPVKESAIAKKLREQLEARRKAEEEAARWGREGREGRDGCVGFVEAGAALACPACAGQRLCCGVGGGGADWGRLG